MYSGKNGSTEHCKGNKTVPKTEATTRTEDGHKQNNKTSTAIQTERKKEHRATEEEMEGPTSSGVLRNRLTRINLHEHDDDDIQVCNSFLLRPTCCKPFGSSSDVSNRSNIHMLQYACRKVNIVTSPDQNGVLYVHTRYKQDTQTDVEDIKEVKTKANAISDNTERTFKNTRQFLFKETPYGKI
jgi:hypothetical protein